MYRNLEAFEIKSFNKYLLTRYFVDKPKLWSIGPDKSEITLSFYQLKLLKHHTVW